MKIHFIFVVFSLFFGSLLADSMLSENDIIANIPLKENQVLLFDSRTQKAIGIIEITPDGKILRIPLPKKSKNDNTTQNISTPTPTPIVKADSPKKDENTQDTSTSLPSTLKSQTPLINKNKQWDKKKIPYLIKEEIIPTE